MYCDLGFLVTVYELYTVVSEGFWKFYLLYVTKDSYSRSQSLSTLSILFASAPYFLKNYLNFSSKSVVSIYTSSKDAIFQPIVQTLISLFQIFTFEFSVRLVTKWLQSDQETIFWQNWSLINFWEVLPLLMDSWSVWLLLSYLSVHRIPWTLQ